MSSARRMCEQLSAVDLLKKRGVGETKKDFKIRKKITN